MLNVTKTKGGRVGWEGGGGEEFVGHDVFCPTWGRFSPSEERCTMLYRNSVVVLISSDLSLSLLLHSLLFLSSIEI